MPAHRIGQYPYRFCGDADVLGGHDGGDLADAVVEVVGPHPAGLESIAASFPDEVGVVAEDESVDHVPQPCTIPRASSASDGLRDLGVDDRGDGTVAGYEVGPRDDQADLVLAEDPVAQGGRDLGEPISQGEGFVDQYLGAAPRDGGLAGDAGGAVGVAVHHERIGVLAGGDEPVVHDRDRLVATPGEIGLAPVGGGQPVREGDHVVFVDVGRFDPGEELAR